MSTGAAKGRQVLRSGTSVTDMAESSSPPEPAVAVREATEEINLIRSDSPDPHHSAVSIVRSSAPEAVFSAQLQHTDSLFTRSTQETEATIEHAQERSSKQLCQQTERMRTLDCQNTEQRHALPLEQPEPEMFCATCRTALQIVITGRSKRSEVEHHMSYRAFQDAVAGGCFICRRLARDGPDFDMSAGLMDAFCMRVIILWATSPMALSFYRTDINNWTPVRFRLVRVPVQSNEDPPTINDLCRCNLIKDINEQPYANTDTTGSKKCLTLAAEWLNRCIEGHSTCERPPPETLLDWKPSRLLYIGNRDDQGLRLCEQQAIPVGVKYTTLSHCWGTNSDRKCLSQQNHTAWTSALPEEALMRTFHDAIKITRSLGIQYIWIDSLCIIQDSEADWLRESSLMSNVYKYSYCNIAAAASSSDDEGCFRERDPLSDPPLRFDYSNLEVATCDQSGSDQSGSWITIEDEMLEGIYDIQRDRTWHSQVDFCPLSKRAWVLQERLLSPRIVYFAGTQLYWECNELRASESYPNGMPDEELGTSQFNKRVHPFNLLRQYSEAIHTGKGLTVSCLRTQAFEVWSWAVEHYTIANLTFPKDKLVAISAIAREMKPLMQCRYLAGHWEIDLLRQLAWSSGLGPEVRPTTYRAPSWSWASVDTAIDVFTEMYKSTDHYYPLIEVISAHIELAGDDEMGQVKGGHLDVLGQLYEMNLERTPRQKINLFRKIFIEGLPTGSDFCMDDYRTELEDPFYFMPLFLSFEMELDFFGLALQRNGSTDTYCRVGSVHAMFWGNNLQKDDPIITLFGKVEWKEDGNHTFSKDTSRTRAFRIV